MTAGVEFDITTHHRQRTRRAEARANALEVQRARLERLLALAIQVAAGQDCDPLTLLAALERLDEEAQNPSLSDDALIRILRGAA